MKVKICVVLDIQKESRSNGYVQLYLIIVSDPPNNSWRNLGAMWSDSPTKHFSSAFVKAIFRQGKVYFALKDQEDLLSNFRHWWWQYFPIDSSCGATNIGVKGIVANLRRKSDEYIS